MTWIMLKPMICLEGRVCRRPWAMGTPDRVDGMQIVRSGWLSEAPTLGIICRYILRTGHAGAWCEVIRKKPRLAAMQYPCATADGTPWPLWTPPHVGIVHGSYFMACWLITFQHVNDSRSWPVDFQSIKWRRKLMGRGIKLQFWSQFFGN